MVQAVHVMVVHGCSVAQAVSLLDEARNGTRTQMMKMRRLHVRRNSRYVKKFSKSNGNGYLIPRLGLALMQNP